MDDVGRLEGTSKHLPEPEAASSRVTLFVNLFIVYCILAGLAAFYYGLALLVEAVT